jgi:hypothetical protein
MTRFSIGNGARDDARAQNAGAASEADAEDREHSARALSNHARSRFHANTHFDWMDHYPIFDTTDW